MKAIVYHGYYGCETGCCGHWVSLDDSERFSFSHADDREDIADYVRMVVQEKFGSEHIADIDFDSCKIVTSEDCEF